ncbi:MAG TPA: RidA family protein [Burkholderiales bacterium]|nr:RidA family protein [Burkholderiales bacterium]
MRASIERFGSSGYVRAGNWIFGTGLRSREARTLFEGMQAQLSEAGSSMSRVARLDQYYPDARCVGPYHAARKQAFGAGQIAPSTSVIVSRLQSPDAGMDVQVIAAASDSGYVPEPVQAGLNRPETSGYTPCLRVGDLIFVAGQLARDASGELAAHGTSAETEYLVRRRLLPALEAAGTGMDLVLKAQVYLSRPQDLAAFWQSWTQAFGNRVPPTTVVPLRHPAFLSSEATVEVNVIAAHRSARARVRDIECEAEARVLDGLLFIGGLTGIDQAESIFAAAGTNLSNVVRALYFHSNIGELRDPGFPFTAVEAADGPIVDLWGYAPNA